MDFADGHALLAAGGVESANLSPANGEVGAAPPPPIADGEVSPTDPIAAVPPEERRVLRTGSRGEEVVYAQHRLNTHGAAEPALITDGIFGPLTRRATIAYQNSHALAADAIIGPKTWRSLDGPVHVGTSAGHGAGGPAGGTAVMQYDNTSYPLPALAPGTKRDVPIAAIKTKQTSKPPDLGGTIKVENAPMGTPEEVHLYDVIAKLGSRARWNTEVDLVTAIGFVPKNGGAAPKGRVQLRIDGRGNATASLLGQGAATVAATYADVAAARAGLIAAYGLKGVVNGDKAWSVDDLNKVNAAFGRLSAGEKAALQGVELKRMRALLENGKPAAGMFATSHDLSPDQKTATSTATLSLADSAFAHDLTNFIGASKDAAPLSFQTILHEVGHAVEEAERYKARKVEFEATADVNRKVEVFNQEVANTNSLYGPMNSAITASNRARQGYTPAVNKAAAKYLAAIDACTSPVAAYGRFKKASDSGKLESAARVRLTARASQKAALQSAAPTNPALTDLADVETRQDELFAAAKKRATALVDMDAAKTTQAAAKTRTAGTETNGQTKRLAAFAAFTKKNRIPPLTAYAATGVGEFFAEAFSLWGADPDYLKTASATLFGWFQRGEHLK